MSRLIDADELLKRINEGAIRFFIQVPREHIETVNTVLELCGQEIKKVINEQPTAYYVDKVVDSVREDCYTMGFDESQTEVLVTDIRNGWRDTGGSSPEVN